MVSKRGDELPRPKPWNFVFGDRQPAQGWDELLNSAENAAWVAITSEPRRTDQRQHQLKGSQATGPYRGKELPKWQYELTGAGRIWYLVDEADRTLVIVHAGLGHPGATDRGKQRRR